MVLEKITACGNSPRLYPSPNNQNLQCSCSPDHEKEMGYAVLEIFLHEEGFFWDNSSKEVGRHQHMQCAPI